MNQYFQQQTGRIFWEFSADTIQKNYWDDHWEKIINNPEKFLIEGRPSVLIRKLYNFKIKKLIPENAKLLEAGCGIGQKVFHLQKEGYKVEGIDYAKEIVNKMKKYVNIFHGDLNHIPRYNSIYDCCISYGVVEHAIDGPDSILSEMHRVTKKSGIVFCSVPHINIIRKLKIILKLYNIKKNINKDKFYQYAFSKSDFLKILNSCGYKIINTYNYAALKGIKDEVRFLNWIILKIYCLKFPFNFVAKILDYGLGFISGHMKMYVLKVIK